MDSSIQPYSLGEYFQKWWWESMEPGGGQVAKMANLQKITCAEFALAKVNFIT